MPARRAPSAAFAAAASRAAASGSKCASPTVSSTRQPLRAASLASARMSVGSSTELAHAGGGVAGSLHATRVSAETPPKRSTPGPSERSSLTKSPPFAYAAT